MKQEETKIIHDEISDLMNDLLATNSAKLLAREFGVDRKTIYSYKYGCQFLLTSNFVAGLRVFGYDLKLVKRK